MLTPLSAATIVSIPASVDGYVQSSGVLGLSTSATNDEVNIDTSMSGGNNVRYGIYEFDLGSVPDGSTIVAATLQLTTSRFISNTGGNPAPVSIYGYTGDGVVSTSDYDGTSPTIAFLESPTGTGAGSTPSGTTLDYVFNDLAALTAANNSAGDIFGAGSRTISFVSFRVASLENETFAPPTLVVSYVPEPGSTGLLLLGGLGMMTRRIRK